MELKRLFLFCEMKAYLPVVKLKTKMICIGLGLACTLSVFGKTEISVATRALGLIDTAAHNVRMLPGFFAVSYEMRGDSAIVTKSYVRNDSDGLHLSRIDRTVLQGNGKPLTEIYLCNRAGFWILKNGKAVRAEQEMQFGRPVPLRLATAFKLGVKDVVSYRLEKNINYFGSKCTKVTVSVYPNLMQKLRENPKMLKKSLEAIYAAQIKDKASAEAFEKNWLKLAEINYPVVYIYLIDSQTPFILSWQEYSFTGEKIGEVSYKEFKVEPALPDSLFEIPPGYALATQAAERPAQ